MRLRSASDKGGRGGCSGVNGRVTRDDAYVNELGTGNEIAAALVVKARDDDDDDDDDDGNDNEVAGNVEADAGATDVEDDDEEVEDDWEIPVALAPAASAAPVAADGGADVWTEEVSKDAAEDDVG